jgi:hypothetical protein
MIFYLWEAVRDTPEPRFTLGVSDDDKRAREAAEDCLRDGQVGLARVELARLATNALRRIDRRRRRQSLAKR